MSKKLSCLIVVACFIVVFFPLMASAGIDPSPSEPEINKLHSIELNVAAINKRLAKLDEFETPPQGTGNYL